MKSLNRVTFAGHLAGDVELRQTKTGKSVANFLLALNRNSKDEKGEKSEVTDFHRIVAWGRLGEICHEYLAKGSAIFLEGKLIKNVFNDKNQVRQYRVEVVAERLNILTWKKSKTGEPETCVEELKEPDYNCAVATA